MKPELRKIVDGWTQAIAVGGSRIYPGDADELLRHRLPWNKHLDFDSYVSDEKFGPEDDRLHLSLLPSPYAGDLQRADIFILTLNPGFGLVDFYAEKRVDWFQRRLSATISQSVEGDAYPFMWLDPELCWHGGFRYWERNLRPVIARISSDICKGSYLKALQHVSKRIAIIELVGYHSVKHNISDRTKGKLPSVRDTVNFVQKLLQPAARDGDKLIIALRGIKYWGLQPRKGSIIVYPPKKAQGASLGDKSDAFAPMLTFLQRR